tara:strand:- start:4474 stop:4776 length:303 start_codon:yes stop_codon:yes gene_type:complete
MTVLQFALRDRWIVTVESERVLVNVRHRTRWYAIERRHGHEARAHWCASRRAALKIADMLRDGHEKQNDPAFQWFCAWYAQQRESVKADLPKQQGKTENE